MDERADLPSGLDARVYERADELGRGDVRERDASTIDALERLRGRRGETSGVAVEFDERNLLRWPAGSSESTGQDSRTDPHP
jgi:hypothetical protein